MIPAREINTDVGITPELCWVPVDQIDVDENYQRALKPKRVAQILRDFNWAHFQPVMLTQQESGRFNVFDGQHRVEAARQHPHITEVPAAVVHIEHSCDEAGAFLGVNVNRTALSTVDKYWAGIEAGDASMMAICAVLDEAGCEVVPANTKSPAPKRTNAVTAVDRAIKTYGEAAVTQACGTLVVAWPKDNSALGGILIQALARLFRNNPTTISRERMELKLRSKDRKLLMSDAETMRRLSGGDAHLALAKTLVEIYNKGLQLNHIQIGAKS